MIDAKEIDIEDFKRAMSYDPNTGILRWRYRKDRDQSWNTKYAGKEIKNRDSKGYVKINFEGRYYQAHRIIWAMMTGAWPEHIVDHKDLQKDNNQWSNLRKADPTTNIYNTPLRKDNIARLKGVYARPDGRFRAKISIDGKSKVLGVLDCPAAAHFLYVVAADKRSKEFARFA